RTGRPLAVADAVLQLCRFPRCRVGSCGLGDAPSALHRPRPTGIIAPSRESCVVQSCVVLRVLRCPAGASPMRLFLAFIGLVATVVALAAAAFFLGGFYNVAASEEDPQIVTWALPQVRSAAIDRHSVGLKPPQGMSLDDQAVIQAGAKAF